jgi:CDGSH-type Zn-finger protein
MHGSRWLVLHHAGIQPRMTDEQGVQLRFYPNGPILFRGEMQLVDVDGNVIPRRRKTVALCRCGHSSLNPFCDGTHRLVRRFNPDGRVDPAP